MPRKRYLSTTAGTDKELSKVSPLAAAAFLLAIPHADGFGRLTGDPDEFGFTVLPAFRLSEEQAEKIINELVAKKLLIAWQFNEKRVLAFKEKSWITGQGRALNQGSRPEHPEPPAHIDNVLRVGFSLTAMRNKYGLKALRDTDGNENPQEDRHFAQTTPSVRKAGGPGGPTAAQKKAAATIIRKAVAAGTWETLSAMQRQIYLDQAGLASPEELLNKESEE